MNGATAELCAKISSPPTIKSTMIIGVSHHHLFGQKNWSSSPAIANRLTRFWIRRMPAPRLPSSQGLLHDDIPEDEGVHSAVVERSERLEWCVDDRLAPQVEGRVEHERYTRSEEHTSELQSPCNLVCRLLLEKKKRQRDN